MTRNKGKKYIILLLELHYKLLKILINMII